MDPLDIVYLTALLDTMHQPNRSGAKTSALNETANSAYGANQVPIEQYLSPLTGESPNTAHANLKRKAPETATDREKKREIDRAYRLRCREKKMKTEQDVVVLTEENNKLKRENEQLKREGVKQPEMVQTQKEEMKVVKNKLCHLKDKLQTQNAVVKSLSGQVPLSTMDDAYLLQLHTLSMGGAAIQAWLLHALMEKCHLIFLLLLFICIDLSRLMDELN